MSERVSGVVYDVDETLYDNDANRVPPLARDTINNLTVPAWMATGRSYPLAIKLENHGVHLNGLGILDSGATIADFTHHEVAWSNWLDAQRVTEILRKVGRRCMEISTSTLDKRIQHDPRAIGPNFSYTQESPSVFGVYGLGERRTIEDMLCEIPHIQYRFMRYEDSVTRGCFQVTHTGLDKQSGVERLLKMTGHQGEPLAAIGNDYVGDMPLFNAVRAVGRGSLAIAMGNSDDQLKH